ncbi:hypothetical protein [Elizabethkingia anophelis]|uniref:hypothetical protein n=1 Tax=Elizabethkingia anophelis TaxID=1117645 RepID=UPI0038927C7F
MKSEKKERELILKEYVSPELEVSWIEMEQGIAAQSANVNISGGTAANTPDAQDWTDQGTLGDGNTEF